MNKIADEPTKSTAGEILENIEQVEKNERDKRFVTWSGVIFFMLIIFALWFVNIRKEFRVSGEEGQGDFDWVKFSQQINQTVREAKTNFSAIKEEAGELKEEVRQQSGANESAGGEQVDLETLKNKLEEITK